MTDEMKSETEATETNTNTAVPPAGAQSTDTPTADHMIPKGRFDEVNNELKKLKAEREKAAKEQEKQERERLEKQNEFKSLYEQAQQQVEQLTPFKERYEAFLDQTVSRNKERIEALSEEMRTLVPEYDDPIKLSSWLDTNEATLAKKPSTPWPKQSVGSQGVEHNPIKATLEKRYKQPESTGA